MACQQPEVTPSPPIILVTLDTTRADRLGCYGYQSAKTPNIDKLAERGTRFEHAIAPVPLTIPSHSTIHTGLRPPRHGVRDNGDQRLSAEAFTLAERLQQQGWRTHATVGAYVTRSEWGFGQGFDRYDQDFGIPTDRLSWRVERPAEEVIDDALNGWRSGSNFLWVHLFDAHAPYDKAPDTVSLADASEAQRYDAEIAHMDKELGRLLSELPDDALIIVVGDHGEAFGDGGESQHGLLLTDSVLQVPFIIAGPTIPVSTRPEPVSLADILPTIAGRLGWAPLEDIDGVDLFADPSTEPNRPGIYSESHYGTHHFGWAPLSAVTTPTGRLIHGQRDHLEGEVSTEARTWLNEVQSAHPAWQTEVTTLSPSEIEQLQALGYVGVSTPSATQTSDLMDPHDGITLIQQMAAIRTQQPSEQIKNLQTLIQTAPQMRDAHFRLALLFASRGRLNEAIASATTAFQSAPDSTSAILLANLWSQAGVPQEGLSWAREAMHRNPASTAAMAAEVTALVHVGALDEAAASAEVALTATPDNGPVLVSRGLLALALGEPVEEWTEAITDLALSRPFEPGNLMTAAALQRESGQLERAQELLRAELKWRPGNVPARLELWKLYEEQNRLVDAVKVLKPLLKLDPYNPQWRLMTAQIYQKMDRPDLAAPFLKEQADPL